MLHLILTDTDNAALMFIFICELDCPEDEGRRIILEIIFKTGIKERFHFPDYFFQAFDEQEPSLKKQVCLYEIESISNLCVITIAFNLK